MPTVATRCRGCGQLDELDSIGYGLNCTCYPYGEATATYKRAVVRGRPVTQRERIAEQVDERWERREGKAE